MQTFLPYQDFQKSLACLDNKRLGKQRVEALQILNTLTGKSRGWRNHPAVRMWRGYESSLYTYACRACYVWKERGFRDTCEDKLEDLFIEYFGLGELFVSIADPPWLGSEHFHASHRSNLLRKDPIHYGQFGWTEPNNLPYIWPV